MLIKKNSKNKP